MRLFFTCGIVLAISTFLFACSSFESPLPDYEKIAEEITKKTAKKLKEQKKLWLVGTGGRMMDDIQAMNMSFDYYQEVNLKIARELIVYVVNEYLLDINSSKEIKSYLHQHPFTAKNVEIRIWIYNSDKSKPSSEKIYYISAIDGILDYYIRGSEKYSRQTICEETYEDALKIVISEE